MSFVVPRRIVVSNRIDDITCVVSVREFATQIVKVSTMTCECEKRIYLCISQSAAIQYRFEAAAGSDFSLAPEITFDVWQGGISGANLISKSFTGGTINKLSDNTFSTNISNAESKALPVGRHYSEVWVTLLNGDRRKLGAGPFRVIDTRRYDA